MVTVTYRRQCWENGNLELIPEGFKREGKTPTRIRLTPSDILELPELVFPSGYPIPRVKRAIKKILAVYFRERIQLVLE